MKQKYTIVIEPELHDWFAHQAIDTRSNISALIADAMEAYKRERSPKHKNLSSVQSNTEASLSQRVIPEHQAAPYVKKIYHPNTTTLNDTPRAREVSKAAIKVVALLKKAKAVGVSAQNIHDILGGLKFNFQTRREALTYLRDNGVAKRRRADWVHADFYQRSSAHPQPASDDSASRG